MSISKSVNEGLRRLTVKLRLTLFDRVVQYTLEPNTRSNQILLQRRRFKWNLKRRRTQGDHTNPTHASANNNNNYIKLKTVKILLSGFVQQRQLPTRAVSCVLFIKQRIELQNKNQNHTHGLLFYLTHIDCCENCSVYLRDQKYKLKSKEGEQFRTLFEFIFLGPV